MDIHAGILAAILLIAAGGFFFAQLGVRSYMSARKLSFYRLRKQREFSSWRFIGIGVLMFLVVVGLALYGEPVVYSYFPPSPTITLTSTITLTPTITLSPTLTLSPTITDTPSVTDTPTPTSTPFLPPAIEALFSSEVTPNPAAIFSPLQFTADCTDFNNYTAVTVFENPLNYVCAIFSYDQMMPGAQWTTLWLRDGELVNYETKPWDGTTGGYGYTECSDPIGGWQPGTYEVQVFVGTEWKVVGQFLVQGDFPTPSPTISPTFTTVPTSTRTPSLTPAEPRTPNPASTP